MIVNLSHHNSNFDPCIQTEEIIFSLLKKNRDLFSDEIELFPYSLTVLINEGGIDATNRFISSCHSNRKRLFVSQHIWTEFLSFKSDDIVCTPHSKQSDNFISIPHQSVNANKKFRSREKDLDFSFIGNIGAHQCRIELARLYPDRVKNSGIGWGLDLQTPQSAKDHYLDLMGRSFFSLCPRGTGISSVRLFEAMCTGSIPIIIADEYKYPLSHLINWNDFSITVPENSIHSIEKIVSDLLQDPDRIKDMQRNLSETYDLYFSNENLHRSIDLTLNN